MVEATVIVKPSESLATKESCASSTPQVDSRSEAESKTVGEEEVGSPLREKAPGNR
jgi:hypothetical protein